MTVAMINRKTRKGTSKGKMANYLKQARRGLLGFILNWSDADPFGGERKIIGGSVSHTNPMQRLIVQEKWRQCKDWICQTEFVWLVEMKVVYTTANGKTKVDSFEFQVTSPLMGEKSQLLNDAMEREMAASRLNQQLVPDDCKTKGTFKCCQFTARIIGV